MIVLEAILTVPPNKAAQYHPTRQQLFFYYTHYNADAMIYTNEIYTSSALSVNHVDPIMPVR